MQSNRERRSATAVAQRIGGGWLWCASMAWRSKNFVRGFLAAVSRPLLAHCFSLCDLRLFVNEGMLLASAARLAGTHWAAFYASSLLTGSRAQARRGAGAFAPAPAAHVPASR